MTLAINLILAAVSLTAPLFCLLSKRITPARYAFLALLSFSTLFALGNSVYPPDYAIHEWTPFKPFFDIAAYGYQSIFESFLQFALPFVFIGLLLPLAFPKHARGIGRAAVCGLTLAAISIAARLLLPLERSVNIDEAWYAALGAAAGYSLYTLLSWIWLRKASFAKALPHPQAAGRIAAIAVLAVVYFGAALLMIVDSLLPPPLDIPSSSSPLPANRTLSFTPETDSVKLSLYKAEEADLSRDYSSMISSLGINGDIVLTRSDNALRRVFAEYSGRSMELLLSGEWHYLDKMAEEASRSPMALSEAESIAKANEFLDLTGLAPERELMDVTRLSATDDDGNDLGASAYAVYFYSVLDGHPLRSTGEISVTVGFMGNIVSADKYGPCFVQTRNAAVISLKEAADTALKQDVPHTLYSEADSVVFSGGRLSYWYDNATGQLSPIWVLTGASDQGEPFEAFVKAQK